MKLESHYSGKNSIFFWKSVNDLVMKKQSDRIYRLGCILQSLEGFVLDELERAQKRRANVKR